MTIVYFSIKNCRFAKKKWLKQFSKKFKGQQKKIICKRFFFTHLPSLHWSITVRIVLQDFRNPEILKTGLLCISTRSTWKLVELPWVPWICLFSVDFLLLSKSIHESCPWWLLVSLRKVPSALFGSWPRYSYEAKNRTTEYKFDIFGALLLYMIY